MSICAIKRFPILHRDAFQCLYCGSKPGIESLHVDHLLPKSKGGSDWDGNLVAACSRCNLLKKDRLLLPPSFYLGPEDRDGFRPWKQFGTWSAMVNIESLVIENQRTQYWIGHNRIYELDWERHIGQKRWPIEEIDDCFEAIHWLKQMVKNPSAC